MRVFESLTSNVDGNLYAVERYDQLTDFRKIRQCKYKNRRVVTNQDNQIYELKAGDHILVTADPDQAKRGTYRYTGPNVRICPHPDDFKPVTEIAGSKKLRAVDYQAFIDSKDVVSQTYIPRKYWLTDDLATHAEVVRRFFNYKQLPNQKDIASLPTRSVIVFRNRDYELGNNRGQVPKSKAYIYQGPSVDLTLRKDQFQDAPEVEFGDAKYQVTNKEQLGCPLTYARKREFTVTAIETGDTVGLDVKRVSGLLGSPVVRYEGARLDYKTQTIDLQHMQPAKYLVHHHKAAENRFTRVDNVNCYRDPATYTSVERLELQPGDTVQVKEDIFEYLGEPIDWGGIHLRIENFSLVCVGGTVFNPVPGADILHSAHDLETGEIVQTRGYYQPYDGGGAVYRIHDAQKYKRDVRSLEAAAARPATNNVGSFVRISGRGYECFTRVGSSRIILDINQKNCELLKAFVPDPKKDPDPVVAQGLYKGRYQANFRYQAGEITFYRGQLIQLKAGFETLIAEPIPRIEGESGADPGSEWVLLFGGVILPSAGEQIGIGGLTMSFRRRSKDGQRTLSVWRVKAPQETEDEKRFGGPLGPFGFSMSNAQGEKLWSIELHKPVDYGRVVPIGDGSRYVAVLENRDSIDIRQYGVAEDCHCEVQLQRALRSGAKRICCNRPGNFLLYSGVTLKTSDTTLEFTGSHFNLDFRDTEATTAFTIRDCANITIPWLSVSGEIYRDGVYESACMGYKDPHWGHQGALSLSNVHRVSIGDLTCRDIRGSAVTNFDVRDVRIKNLCIERCAFHSLTMGTSNEANLPDLDATYDTEQRNGASLHIDNYTCRLANTVFDFSSYYKRGPYQGRVSIGYLSAERIWGRTKIHGNWDVTIGEYYEKDKIGEPRLYNFYNRYGELDYKAGMYWPAVSLANNEDYIARCAIGRVRLRNVLSGIEATEIQEALVENCAVGVGGPRVINYLGNLRSKGTLMAMANVLHAESVSVTTLASLYWHRRIFEESAYEENTYQKSRNRNFPVGVKLPKAAIVYSANISGATIGSLRLENLSIVPSGIIDAPITPKPGKEIPPMARLLIQDLQYPDETFGHFIKAYCDANDHDHALFGTLRGRDILVGSCDLKGLTGLKHACARVVSSRDTLDPRMSNLVLEHAQHVPDAGISDRRWVTHGADKRGNTWQWVDFEKNLFKISKNPIGHDGGRAFFSAATEEYRLPNLFGGATSARPVLGEKDAGVTFVDTDLEKPVFWTGVRWVDATGVPS